MATHILHIGTRNRPKARAELATRVNRAYERAWALRGYAGILHQEAHRSIAKTFALIVKRRRCQLRVHR